MPNTSAATRYVVKPNDDPPHPSLYRFSHLVFDTAENRVVAYASPQQKADDYAQELNDKGFIEP